MQSITKTKLSREQILKMIRKAFGEKVCVNKIHELTEGYFNTAYLIILKDGSKSVLKISPPQEVTVMSYEQSLMVTEVNTLNSIYEIGCIPVPKVLYYDQSKELVNSDYFFMEFIEGQPLNNVRNQLTDQQFNSISIELGLYAKKIKEVNGAYFGSISRENKRFSTWSDAFLNMIKELLYDANEMDVCLPYSDERLYTMISQYEKVLNEVEKPLLVHKDLWEGNIFYDSKTSKITGIIDCERSLYGDPLLEPVCGFWLENKGFMNAYMGREELDKNELIRVTLYKVYLYLLMIIEGAYRQYSDKSIEEWARVQLNETLECLSNIK